jgi:predicted ABC-type ATPase
MRVFAGPNGSGKTTIFKEILQSKDVNLGVYVNADEIEVLLREGCLSFNDFYLQPTIDDIQNWFKHSKFASVKRKEPELWNKLTITGNVMQVDTDIDSYIAADIAEFIRRQLLAGGMSFTYETVMSHPDKVHFMQKAQMQGYRVYLYYIATEAPEINISRVNVRVTMNGHNVAPDVITSRYYKSLGLLKAAVKNSDRSYVFDNSGSSAVFIAEITNGNYVMRNEIAATPAWVEKYLFE